MKSTALITGASSGIGHELSKIFAMNGHDLVLIARSKQQLEIAARELKDRHDIQIKVISKDLSKPAASQEVYDEITSEGIDVDVLVNNAGIGTNGKFIDSPFEEHMDLMQLNIVSLTNLCKLFGTDMASRGSGSILNVASTAAFQAGPFMSTYYASKAYVLMFSEGLSKEFKYSGVTITTLCPGPTKTDFFEKAGMKNSILMRSPHALSAARVAKVGYEGLLKGKTIVIPGLINKLMVFSVRLTPRSMITTMTAYLNQK